MWEICIGGTVSFYRDLPQDKVDQLCDSENPASDMSLLLVSVWVLSLGFSVELLVADCSVGCVSISVSLPADSSFYLFIFCPVDAVWLWSLARTPPVVVLEQK